MDAVETAVALKSLQEENASLKILLRELEDAIRFRREQELVDSVKERVTAWAKRIAGLFALVAVVLGVSTFLSAKNAVIYTFEQVTEPQLRQKFSDEMLPQIKRDLESAAAKRVDEFTSASTKQFDQQMKALYADLVKFAQENKLQEPERLDSIDVQARPTKGYVLKSFLVPSRNNNYMVNTFRLNVRDTPGGTIMGRLVQDDKVIITEQQGDWVRVETQQ